MKRGKRGFIPIIAVLAICIILNVTAWKSAAFSDFYANNIFPYVTSLLSRINSVIPFSVGEWLLVALVLFVAFTVTFIFVHSIFLLYFKIKKPTGRGMLRAKKVFDKISDSLYRFTPVLLTATMLIMTLNCFIIYHCSSIKELQDSSDDYDLQQLADLRDYVVKKCNSLSAKVPHDEDGNVVYEGDMAATAVEAMKVLSEDFPRLSGFYTTPKALYFSDFMCQQYMQGYYFPFSMEANYNDMMSIMNKPFTMCHELAHTKGFIYEDEANYLAFLACINSDDVVFQYSGYLGVLNYINNDFYNAVEKDIYNSHVKICDRVKYDNQFVTKENWIHIEEKAIIKTATVKKAAAKYVDSTLKMNGVLSGSVSYCQVVGLIMDYYYSGVENPCNAEFLVMTQ